MAETKEMILFDLVRDPSGKGWMGDMFRADCDGFLIRSAENLGQTDYYDQLDEAKRAVLETHPCAIVWHILDAEIIAKMATPGGCIWEPYEMGTQYYTSCGSKWEISCGSIEIKKLTFCPFCGKPIEEKNA